MTICTVCQVDRTVVVTARDFRGSITHLCRACGAGEDQDDGKAARLVEVKATSKATKGAK